MKKKILIIVALLPALAAFSDNPTNTNAATKGPTTSTNLLTQVEASSLAAELANNESAKRFNRRPFAATTYTAIFKANRWHWGRLDPAGIHGYSSDVSFDAYGNKPVVHVYFSSDELPTAPMPTEKK